MSTLDQVADALRFAVLRHDGQRRKYTNEPYVTHLIAVARKVDVMCYGDVDMVKAALCHDVLEDTETTYEELAEAIGYVAASYVLLLTDSGHEKGNRATRKAIDRERLRNSPTPVKSIKLADLIDNTASIVERDPDFAKVYLAEKRAMLEALELGNPTLLSEARQMLEDGEAKLAEHSSKGGE